MSAIPEEVDQFARWLLTLDKDARQKYEGQLKLLVGSGAATSELVAEPPVRTLGEYLDTPVEVPPMLVEPGVVVRGGLTAMTGRGGKGKTSVNMHRLMRWAMGLPMFPDLPEWYIPTKPLKSLVVENEGAGGLFHEKLDVLVGRIKDPDQRDAVRENVHIWGDGGYSDLRLNDGDSLALIHKALEKYEPDILFMEPFAGLWTGEENSASEMREVLNSLIGVASQYGAGVMIAHHEKKNMEATEDHMSASRGSSVLEGAAAFMERFQPVQAGKYRELIVSKARHPGSDRRLPQLGNVTRMEWREDGSGWYDYVPPERGAEGILELLSCYDPAFVKEISVEAGEPEERVRAHLNKLLKDGRVRREAGSSMGGRGSTGYAWFKVCGDSPEGALTV